MHRSAPTSPALNKAIRKRSPPAMPSADLGRRLREMFGPAVPAAAAPVVEAEVEGRAASSTRLGELSGALGKGEEEELERAKGKYGFDFKESAPVEGGVWVWEELE
mmetsp:Transcript_23737/g.59005  ORF Transcript_23737/g.59005 Transcript_23737/m.59005 type:complete len:106 (-) Transcript_23737:50-367(-)|eukprot:CAMPEP_0184724998 /NCGR_PEP_ID=MMETSP0314-20130426/29634_1 /TAXON_ID=38298 /ORGANISM="Rhodella maculata, Strain CCMP 736" /LENGTH=105 /DNA_ID=CAMNT_0027190127 /DNA_START=207 /DNA_END=524 /DNA_ORIENTATION=-